MVHRDAEETVRPFVHQWYGRLALVALSVLMLTLALAPTRQFYLAWVGLVPWLWVVGESRSNWRAFAWSWLGGSLFFLANLWWLLYVSAPGMIALVIYLGLYWGAAAMLFRLLGMNRTEDSGLRTERNPRAFTQSLVLSPQSSPPPAQSYVFIVFGIATIITALEWVRGWMFTGLPWLYLGHTQSPILALCQIADLFGVYGISFCVAAVNGVVYLGIKKGCRGVWPAAAVVAGLWVASGLYGWWRWEQMGQACTPGPTVLVVQSNYPQDNTGDKGATEEERIAFHLKTTAAALEAWQKNHKGADGVDLVCWSETEMPMLNEEFRAEWRGGALRTPDKKVIHEDYGAFLDGIVHDISDLARRHDTNLITGGLFAGSFNAKGIPTDRRNSAFLFRRDGAMAAERSDKIHLVPFGEFIPFKGSYWFGWLHDIFMKFSPYDFDYTLTPGPEESPAVLPIPAPRIPQPVRVVVPICFEDLDAPLVAKMLRGPGRKRADLIVNLTNDGWFKANENTQHLQAALFRSIENRVPTVRSVNTGISGFIDSYGSELQTVPVRTEGTAVQAVRLDSRYTIYTRFGDWFPILCTLASVALAASVAWRRRRARAMKN